jgi:hypothetical protein
MASSSKKSAFAATFSAVVRWLGVPYASRSACAPDAPSPTADVAVVAG